LLNKIKIDQWLPDGSGTAAQRRYSVQPEQELKNVLQPTAPDNLLYLSQTHDIKLFAIHFTLYA
jgi:hypothetical protein